MCSAINSKIKNFDALYAEICDKLRESSSGESINQALEEISKSKSDYTRIKWVLSTDSNVVALFNKNIGSNFVTKNEHQAVKLLREACSQNSLPLINQALQLCRYWEVCKRKEDEEDPCIISTPINIRDQSNLQKFIGLTQKPDSDHNNDSEIGIISEIFSRRSIISFQFGKFESCIRDTFRLANYGASTKSYEIVLRLALSYKHLGFLPEAKLVAEHALDVLRSSRKDNEAKCKETLRLVAIIKEIQHLSSVPSSSSSPSAASSPGKKNIDKGGGSHHHHQGAALKLELFEGQHDALQSSSSALELKFTQERGRHVIAQRDIPPGSTLIIEEPFAWSVTPSKYPNTCQNCLASEPSSSDGIPCPDCASVIFCNEECRDNAIKSFHKYECKILRLLDSSEKLGKMALLCFRSVLQVPLQELVATHNQFMDELEQEQQPSSSNNLLLMGYNSQGKFNSSDYASVFAQTTNSSVRNGGDLLKRTYASIYLVLCLRFVGYHTNNDGSSESNKVVSAESELSETEIILASILLRHLQSVSCNAYGINHVVVQPVISEGGKDKTGSTTRRREELEIEEMGGATFSMISTTNHSCNPNIYRFNVGKACIVNTLSEIKAGEEIFDSYGPLFTTTPLIDRQEELEAQYCFQCKCVACSNNWPTFAQLSSPTKTQGHQKTVSPPSYRCPHCSESSEEEGQIPIDAAKDKRKCPSCGKLVDFKKLVKMLKSAEEKYKRAKDCILKGKLESPSTLQKCICNYIWTLQKIRVVPNKELIEAQELLKLFWNLSVSKNNISI